MEDCTGGWRESFEAFHGRFAGLFGRREPREECRKYLRGLLSTVERRNCWQLAEAVGEACPDAMQRMLYLVDWDVDAARDILQDFVIEEFGHRDAVVVVDETGFLKKGKRSAGVQRQYTGTAGKIENCQVGVFLSCSCERGHAFLDRRLYLPKGWCADQPRREQARIPQAIVFRTKPELAVDMLTHAWDRGVATPWIAGDEVYGDAPAFRQAISQHKSRYVLAVSVNTPVWVHRPRMARPRPPKQDGAHSKAQLAPGAPAATTVAQVVAHWPAEGWQRLTVAHGEKGPIAYDWARQRVVESRGQLPAETVWLVARRSLTDPTDVAYYLSNAPAAVPLLRLAEVAAARFSIERCFEEAKGETGLDQYEVRHWHSWHRHITLAMMAHAWLASVRAASDEKKGTAHRARRTDSP